MRKAVKTIGNLLIYKPCSRWQFSYKAENILAMRSAKNLFRQVEFFNAENFEVEQLLKVLLTYKFNYQILNVDNLLECQAREFEQLYK